MHNWSWNPATATAPVDLHDVLADKPQAGGQPFLLEAWDVRVLVER